MTDHGKPVKLYHCLLNINIWYAPIIAVSKEQVGLDWYPSWNLSKYDVTVSPKLVLSKPESCFPYTNNELYNLNFAPNLPH